MAIAKVTCLECGDDDLDDVVCDRCYRAVCEEASDAQSDLDELGDSEELSDALETVGRAVSDWHYSEHHDGPFRFCLVALCRQVRDQVPMEVS